MRGWNSLLALLFVVAIAGAAWVLLTVDDEAVQAVAAVVDVLLVLGGGLLTWRASLAGRRRSSTPEQRDAALRSLSDEMRRRLWLPDERPYPALMAPEPLAVRWRVRTPSASAPAHIHSASGQETGEGAGALIAWMSRVASRRAALIGEPGAGKTTLVALVARELLQHDRSDRADPVPVIVSLADWDPSVDPLERWISLRLSAQFPELKRRELYGRDVALSLVRNGQVFPILDGLDSRRFHRGGCQAGKEAPPHGARDRGVPNQEVRAADQRRAACTADEHC